MHLSRIQIANFRNFASVDFAMSSNAVILGENRVGKSNLLFAMRLVLDPSLPDSARQLKLSDIWEGLDAAEMEAGPTIEVHLDFKEFDGNPALTTLLTDHRLAADHTTARLSYVFRKKHGVAKPAESDYEFKVFGGGDETRQVPSEVRRRICLDVLPALRDAEGELSTWRTSPLRPLLDDAIAKIDRADLEEISEEINEATGSMTALEPIKTLEDSIRAQMLALAGERHDIRAKFGFAPSDPVRMFRSIRVLIDDGVRSMGEASLGSANLALLTLKLAEFEWRRSKNERNFTLIAVEEPEAHLHPHLQRKVFGALFSDPNQVEAPTRSLLLTTHSPSIASVAPIRSIVVLSDGGQEGTHAYSMANINIEDDELDDLQRYLDATRAEILFSRGILFVEGDAEALLVPGFARTMGLNLDELGISVCSVGGTNFDPYAQLAAALHIPFAVITDWDPRTLPHKAYGWGRTMSLVRVIREASGKPPLSAARLAVITANEAELRQSALRCHVYLNTDTLETELANRADLRGAILSILAEQDFGRVLKARIQTWQDGTAALDRDQMMLMIGYVSKGRFAGQLAEALDGLAPPDYIRDAIHHVTQAP